MAYDFTKDFISLLRRNGVNDYQLTRMPGMDMIVITLGRAGLFALQVGGSAPVVDQDTTAWLDVASPSSELEGELKMWDGASYVLATPELFANIVLNNATVAGHTHVIPDVTGLTAALAGKSPVGHGHTIADTAGLQTALDGKAPVAHNHAIADVTGLQTALDGKSATGHGHTIADVTGLQTDLDAKVIRAGDTMTGDLAVPSLNRGHLAGFRNKLLNSSFGIWQRGVSFSPIGWIYSADRWGGRRGANALGMTLSKNTDANAINGVAMKMQRDNADTDINDLNVGTSIETFDVEPMQGNEYRLTTRLRKGANYSGGDISLTIRWDAGTDVAPSPYSGTHLSTRSIVSTTAFANYSTVSFIIPATAKSLFIGVWYTPAGTAGVDDAVYIDWVQLEPGTLPTPFEQRPQAVEFAMCQRYYQKNVNNARLLFTATAIFEFHEQYFGYRTEMRATPTFTSVLSSPTNIHSVGIGSNSTSGFTFWIRALAAGDVIDQLLWTAEAEL